MILPGPVYQAHVGGTIVSGAVPHVYPLVSSEGFLLELGKVPESVLRRTRLVYVNYPNNPTAAIAPSLCREIAALARLLAKRRDPAALARLHARVAELYQLSRAEFEHILATVPLIPESERDAALRMFLGKAPRL